MFELQKVGAKVVIYTENMQYIRCILCTFNIFAPIFRVFYFRRMLP